jgi:death-on-curing protein
MITKEEILLIHNQVVLLHGGANGVRELNGLESAIARPYQGFGGEDLYPSCFEKTAALGQSLTINHPFVDRNKQLSGDGSFVIGRGTYFTEKTP